MKLLPEPFQQSVIPWLVFGAVLVLFIWAWWSSVKAAAKCFRLAPSKCWDFLVSVRAVWLLLAGFVLGTAAVLSITGRYSVHITSTGVAVGYVVRLDRWTGCVSSDVLLPNAGLQTHFAP
jgi:hypothetical protein